jgi:hypothetical protein
VTREGPLPCGVADRGSRRIDMKIEAAGAGGGERTAYRRRAYRLPAEAGAALKQPLSNEPQPRTD